MPKLFIHRWVEETVPVSVTVSVISQLIILLILKRHHKWWQGANRDAEFTSLNFFCLSTFMIIHWHELGSPSLGGKHQNYLSVIEWKKSACVSDIRSYCWLFKDTIDVNKVQILAWDSHHLTFLLKYFHDHSLTQVGLPTFEWEMLKLHVFIHVWMEKIVLVSVIHVLYHTIDFFKGTSDGDKVKNRDTEFTSLNVSALSTCTCTFMIIHWHKLGFPSLSGKC